MGVYNTNQVRQLYVVNKYEENISQSAAAGTLGKVAATKENELYFCYQPATLDGLVKSPLIPLKNVTSAKWISKEDMALLLKQVTVTLKDTLQEGVDYVLGIHFPAFFGISPANDYYKDAVVHTTAGMTAEQFYGAMVEALHLAFSREVGANKTWNPYLTFSSDANGLYIKALAQPWHLGMGAPEATQFDVVCGTLYNGAEDIVWGETATKMVASDSPNGAAAAELEWFCMGERGDQYRYAGYPNYIPTKYLVDSAQDYCAIEIHYTTADTGVNSYNTEKDLTIISPFGTKGEIAAAIGKAFKAAGLEIENVPTV